MAQARVPEGKAKTAGIVARCHLFARSGVRWTVSVSLVCLAEKNSADVMVAIIKSVAKCLRRTLERRR